MVTIKSLFVAPPSEFSCRRKNLKLTEDRQLYGWGLCQAGGSHQNMGGEYPSDCVNSIGTCKRLQEVYTIRELLAYFYGIYIYMNKY